MKEYTYRLWPFLSFTEVPAYMEWMERKGLRFDGLCCFSLFARYCRAEPREAEYCWDYFEPEDFVVIQDYLDMCEAGGWEIAWQFQRRKVFRKIDGTTPWPLYSEEEMGQKRRRLAKKTELFYGIIFLLVFAFLLFLNRWNTFDRIDPLSLWGEQIYKLSAFYGTLGIAAWCLWNGLHHFFQKKEELHFDLNRDLWCTAKKLFFLTISAVFIAGVFGDCIAKKGNNGGLVAACVLLYFFPSSQLGFITGNSKNYPVDKRMKGVLPYSLRKCRIAQWGITIVYVLVAAVFVVYPDTIHDETVVSSNIQCKTIALESVGHSSDRYFEARSTKGAEQIIKAYLEDDAWQWEDLKYYQEDLEAEIKSVFLTGPLAVEGQPWDKVYRRSNGYESWLLIQKGLKIWLIDQS